MICASRYSIAPKLISIAYQDLLNQILSEIWNALEQDAIAPRSVGGKPGTYLNYMMGQNALKTLNLPSIRRGRKALKAAVQETPDFQPALAALSRSYHLEWLLLAQGDPQLLAIATQFANQAIEADPHDARGYHELGICTLRAGRFEESQAAYERAIQLQPNRADILADYADTLFLAGSLTQALEEIDRALAHNSSAPDLYWWTKAGIEFELGRYRDAIGCIRRMRDSTPAHRLLAASLALVGETDEAKRYVQLTLDSHPDFNVARWLAIIAIRDRSQASHYETGLRSAGFQ